MPKTKKTIKTKKIKKPNYQQTYIILFVSLVLAALGFFTYRSLMVKPDINEIRGGIIPTIYPTTRPTLTPNPATCKCPPNVKCKLPAWCNTPEPTKTPILRRPSPTPLGLPLKDK